MYLYFINDGFLQNDRIILTRWAPWVPNLDLTFLSVTKLPRDFCHESTILEKIIIKMILYIYITDVIWQMGLLTYFNLLWVKTRNLSHGHTMSNIQTKLCNVGYYVIEDIYNYCINLCVWTVTFLFALQCIR